MRALQNFSSWGRYPRLKSEVFKLRSKKGLKDLLSEDKTFIPFGNGRSYGDSALAPHIIHTRPHNYFLGFDETTGLLKVQAGVLLSEIIDVFVPRGWFIKVTPGTKYITIGGAIASDIHGKNHHVQGCFSECVESFTLMMNEGEVMNCSREENRELFLATCGGMGLTGVLLEAQIYLKKINSKHIEQTTFKTKNLKETFDAFEKNSHIPYSVAWIDCLAKGKKMGRSLLMVGDFSNDGDLDYKRKSTINVPFDFPSFALNKFTVKLFNWFYYNKVFKKVSTSKVSLDSFFYPLDAINNWNRIYGKKGFTQYQFILPKENSFEGLEVILKEISKAGMGSFLAVLKLYGKENENYLSFPIEGYSLALDFKIEKALFPFLDKLDEVVNDFGGRVYLSKDARLTKDSFEKGYDRLSKFKEVRKTYNLAHKFRSVQSDRLGL